MNLNTRPDQQECCIAYNKYVSGPEQEYSNNKQVWTYIKIKR